MNRENIKDLQNQLSVLGFASVGNLVVKKICFKPDSFFMIYETSRGKDKLIFSLYIESDNKNNSYVLKYYDASILKEIIFNHTTINAVDTNLLEKKMASIDWKNIMRFTGSEPEEIDHEAEWKSGILIESIIEDFRQLENEKDGKDIVYNLKLKYWTGINVLEEMANIKPEKNNQKISQRFYIYPGQTGITIEEAYRFLQNMSIEKEIQLIRKKTKTIRIPKTKIKSKKNIISKKGDANNLALIKKGTA